jgi:hypothetical protein
MNGYADTMTNAIDDAARLTAWIEPNEWALQDPIVEEIVLRALGTPIPADLAADVPLLRFASGREPMHLLDAVLAPPVPRYASGRSFRCDYFGDKASEPNTIWIPCGRSVVQMTVRNFARELMQDDNRATLVWWDAD